MRDDITIMMKKLTVEEIKRFVEKPNVKKDDAENFLMSMNTCNGVFINMENLFENAKNSEWNNETIEAIVNGILTAGGLEPDDLSFKN